MAKKAGDPFNFDDIYSSLGASNFVKKPLAELKSSAAHTGAASPQKPVPAVSNPAGKPAGASAAVSHGVTTPAPAPALAVTAVDLDFLGEPHLLHWMRFFHRSIFA